MKAHCLFLSLFVSWGASAQVFKIGHLFDSKESVWKKDQVLVVKDGIISEINPAQIPKNLEQIDLSKFWVTPAFIDAHSHLFLKDKTFGKDFSEGLKTWVNHPKEEKLKLGLARAKSLAKSGFVMVRDLGNQGDITKKDIQKITDIEVISSGAGWVPKLGQLPPGSQKELVKEYRLMSGKVSFDNDLVKLYADEEPNLNVAIPVILENLVKKAHAENKMVAVHAILKDGVEVAVNSGADTLEHGVEISDEQFKKMSQAKMIFVPTLSGALFLNSKRKKLSDDHPVDEFKKACENIKKAKSFSVSVAYGSDHYFDFPQGDYGQEQLEMIYSLSHCGLESNFILQMATYNASRTQNSVRTGVILEGYQADLNIYEHSPEKDLKHILQVKKIFRKGVEIN